MDSLDPRIYWPGGPLCPWLTADLPGIGGWITADVDDFIVDEVPAYAPSGEGDHWFVRIRKRDCTTDAARRVLARAVDIDPCDVGVAGQKDKRTITTQWMSIPVEPDHFRKFSSRVPPSVHTGPKPLHHHQLSLSFCKSGFFGAQP